MKEFNEDLCMRSSYELLLGKKTIDQLTKETGSLYLIFSPEREVIVMIDDVYDTLINYFIHTEEYEKCAEILKAKNDCQ
tara:strand:- start:215 stop:451 length:237 start_codon:yes stop_codon:yes gene_type:complete